MRLFDKPVSESTSPCCWNCATTLLECTPAVAVAVSAMWKQVLGVNAELVNEEWKVFINNQQHGGCHRRCFAGAGLPITLIPPAFWTCSLAKAA